MVARREWGRGGETWEVWGVLRGPRVSRFSRRNDGRLCVPLSNNLRLVSAWIFMVISTWLRLCALQGNFDSSLNWIHRSASKLKLVTGDVNNIDHLVIMQCSAGKPCILPFIWMPLDSHHPSVVQVHPPRGKGAPPSRTMLPDTPQKNCSGLRNTRNCTRLWPGLWITQIPIRSSICRTLRNKSNPWRHQPPVYRMQTIQDKCQQECATVLFTNTVIHKTCQVSQR